MAERIDTGVQTAEALADRMRSAVDDAVASGPDFLKGTIDADTMARHMVATVTGFQDRHLTELQQVADGTLPASPEVTRLWQALGELYVCGSGYLADRCDADCVARTMTEMVHEYPPATA